MIRKIPAEVYSRVVGYFRPVSQWNDGKKEEFKERKSYGTNEEAAREKILS
jgi:anaerobic ribonucleoside-triphosphate reductase